MAMESRFLTKLRGLRILQKNKKPMGVANNIRVAIEKTRQLFRFLFNKPKSEQQQLPALPNQPSKPKQSAVIVYPTNPKLRSVNLEVYYQLVSRSQYDIEQQRQQTLNNVVHYFDINNKTLFLLQLAGKQQKLRQLIQHIIINYHLCHWLADPKTCQDLEQIRENFIQRFKRAGNHLSETGGNNYIGDEVVAQLIIGTAKSITEVKMAKRMFAAKALLAKVLENCVAINSVNPNVIDLVNFFKLGRNLHEEPASKAITFIIKFLAEKEPGSIEERYLQADKCDQELVAQFVKMYLDEISASTIKDIADIPQLKFLLLLISKLGQAQQKAEIADFIALIYRYVDTNISLLTQSTQELQSAQAARFAKIFRLVFTLVPKREQKNLLDKYENLQKSGKQERLSQDIKSELKAIGVLNSQGYLKSLPPASLLAASLRKGSLLAPSTQRVKVSKQQKSTSKASRYSMFSSPAPTAKSLPKTLRSPEPRATNLTLSPISVKT